MAVFRTKPGMSLRVSMLLFLVIPLIGALAIAGYFSLHRLEKQVEQRMQEDIELIARAIRGPLEYALEHGREGSVSQALSSAFRIGRVYGAYVYDDEGRKITASGPREPLVGSGLLAELAAGGDRTGGYQKSEGKEVYSYFVPLTDSAGRNSGLLQLTREGSDFRSYIKEVRSQGVLLLVLLSGLVLCIVVYGHHRVIGRNLGTLVRSMALIEGGDRSHRASPTGAREIRMLALGMNDMLDSIARSEREIEEQRQTQARLESQLYQSRKMAAIGQLAAGVAHELGTPLSVVSGQAQRLSRDPHLPKKVIRELGAIRDAAQRMESIVRQLLDYGRKNRLQTRKLSMEHVAASVVAQLREQAQSSQVELSMAGPRPSPDMQIDPVRMEQALLNLVHNAVQAAPQSGLVRLEWYEDEEILGYRVADNGPGVPEDLVNRLFEPFFTTKPVDEGTGLGLAVAQAAARDHGGTIHCESSDLGGALFCMIFPKSQSSDLKNEYIPAEKHAGRVKDNRSLKG